ncbi:MAG: hypothetical protein ACI4AI_05985 [Paludibacteraceae bacterium]
MENNENFNELQELRSQLAELKKQLALQEIVNDNLIIDSMKRKMKWIKKFVVIQAYMLPLIALLWLGIKYTLGLSWWNYAFVTVMCCVDVYVDYRINLRAITDDDYMKGNLITTIKKLIKMKSDRTKQMLFAIPLIIVWLTWTAIETMQSIPMASGNFHKGFIEGGFFGGIIGGFCGLLFAFKMYRKMQRTNDEIITQINDLIKDE